MKTVNFYLAIAAIAFTTASCVESSSKYKNLLAERDSLLIQNNSVEASYNETLDILNDIESGFREIRETEQKMTMEIKQIEGQPRSKKEQLANEMAQVKQILAENREKIAQLQARLSKNGKENKALLETVKRMETELNEKNTLIASLQEEMAKKNIQITELNTKVDNLSTDVKNLNEVSAQQQSTIQSQDADLNSVWYYVATSKELKTANIVSGNGLFRAQSVMDKDFDKSVFTKTDLRKLSVLPLNVKKAKVLSSHPKGSYELVKGEDKMLTLEIRDTKSFWSVSKYLVIEK